MPVNARAGSEAQDHSNRSQPWCAAGTAGRVTAGGRLTSIGSAVGRTPGGAKARLDRQSKNEAQNATRPGGSLSGIVCHLALQRQPAARSAAQPREHGLCLSCSVESAWMRERKPGRRLARMPPVHAADTPIRGRDRPGRGSTIRSGHPDASAFQIQSSSASRQQGTLRGGGNSTPRAPRCTSPDSGGRPDPALAAEIRGDTARPVRASSQDRHEACLVCGCAVLLLSNPPATSAKSASQIEPSS
jgi:hypothetical protein